jgi:hypothetical protein
MLPSPKEVYCLKMLVDGPLRFLCSPLSLIVQLICDYVSFRTVDFQGVMWWQSAQDQGLHRKNCCGKTVTFYKHFSGDSSEG